MAECLSVLTAVGELLFKALPALFTWVLVIAGWRVVSDFQDRRERTKARLSHLLELRTMLKGVEQVAVEFHTSETYSDALARKVVRSIKLVTSELRHLQKVGVVSGDWPQYVMFIRQAATGLNFDKSTFKPLDGSAEVILNLETRKDQLDDFVLLSAAQLLDGAAPPISLSLIWSTLRGTSR